MAHTTEHAADAPTTGERLQWSGTWQEFTGKAKRLWGVLTDNDFRDLEGRYDEAMGRIKQRTGESMEAIRQRLFEE